VSYWMATKQDVCDIHYTQVQHYSGTAENLWGHNNYTKLLHCSFSFVFNCNKKEIKVWHIFLQTIKLHEWHPAGVFTDLLKSYSDTSAITWPIVNKHPLVFACRKNYKYMYLYPLVSIHKV
jgi:hypothetical protein